ncbi:hypothetical protein H4R33_006674 [Dimargaris cristalligena]|uniref:Delta-12-fatty acid desaturase n=1 Tax=Dimargaris cristalligena TaxID=215637 RepID=A0A4P9ZPD0_9FUNG|nr:hypothetical protein H4R33_006674 [Dimargaris cristalligena]RKP34200.1 delta-12-fatty acid desaturase [Dimargaris cristalligena]|eukprot:RKP34200.1 delta-12-fatty acid desaturase [Dimargaris cristalligena]
MGEKIEYVTPTTDIESTFQPPNISIKELRDAVPAHCFERSALRSSLYVAHDLFFVALFGYLATFIDTSLPISLRLLAWPLYWVAQGIVSTGIWVIGHECGHHSYSSSPSINNAVGWVLHSALLVPFYSWRYSHSNHHKATNHMQRDEVFVPRTRRMRRVAATAPVIPSILAATDDAPLKTLYAVLGMTIAGWPLYVFTNIGGPKYARGSSHFDPNSVLFKPHQYNDILLSDLGVLLALGALSYASYTFSILTVIKFYVIPYLMVNFWLVTITFLQHTHPAVPHYRPKEWTFIRGALATVDRSFGPLLNFCLHNITDTHVAHHLFSTIPHYHAMEATVAIRKVLGPHYFNDQTHWAKALWDTNAHCRFVEDEGDILFWRRPA